MWHVDQFAGQGAAGRDRRLVLIDARRPRRPAFAEAFSESVQPDDLPAELDSFIEQGALGRDWDAQARLLQVCAEPLRIGW